MTQLLVVCPDRMQLVADLGIVVGPTRVPWFVPPPHITGAPFRRKMGYQCDRRSLVEFITKRFPRRGGHTAQSRAGYE
jgi:hypothetical protein